MKLDLEFDPGHHWLCSHSDHHGDCSATMAVIGNVAGAGWGSGLCLQHLYALKDMAWAEAFIPQEITGTLRDALIAEFYRVFPEPEPLVPCPVCGKQPEWREWDDDMGDYNCVHSEGKTAVWTCGSISEPEARAAWNSMRREPVVSAADAPKTKWQVWNVTPRCAITVNGVRSFDSLDEAIAQRDSFCKSFPKQTYEIREVSV